MNLNPFAWLDWDTSPTVRAEPLREAYGISIGADADEDQWRRLTGDIPTFWVTPAISCS